MIVETVDELPSVGEKKIAHWIRGSGDISVTKFKKSSSETHGCGRKCTISLDAWRMLIRQTWLLGYIDRTLVVGGGINMISSLVFAKYSITELGRELLRGNEDEIIELPEIEEVLSSRSICTDPPLISKDIDKVLKSSRNGKGSHALVVLKRLIEEKENWFPITASEEYFFLVFSVIRILSAWVTVKI